MRYQTKLFGRNKYINSVIMDGDEKNISKLTFILKNLIKIPFLEK